MSAFICNETHIATCARIIADSVPAAANMDPADIAQALALENLKSVAFRYGPEARDLYEREMGMAAGDPGPEEDPLADMIPGEQTGRAYMEACRIAAPISCSTAEAHAYLGCLDYQSCEHPQWPESAAWGWIGTARDTVALEMRDELLAGKDTGFRQGKGPLCRPQHIGVCAWLIEKHSGKRIGNIPTKLDLEFADDIAAANIDAVRSAGHEITEDRARKFHADCRKSVPLGKAAFWEAAQHHWLLEHVWNRCRMPGMPGAPDRALEEQFVEAQDSLVHDMRKLLLGERRVWEAPYSPGPRAQAEESPSP